MTGRALLWIGTLIIVSGLLSYYSVERSTISAEAIQSQEKYENDQKKLMQDFLSQQTDGRKLVRFAKNINPENGELIKMVILRAYELEPNSRDIAILASVYDSSIKKKIQEIDPLYK